MFVTVINKLICFLNVRLSAPWLFLSNGSSEASPAIGFLLPDRLPPLLAQGPVTLGAGLRPPHAPG